jgi:hypothetical protein
VDLSTISKPCLHRYNVVSILLKKDGNQTSISIGDGYLINSKVRGRKMKRKRFKNITYQRLTPVIVILTLLVMLAASFQGTRIALANNPLQGQAAPTISSDLPDYNPGGTVTLTGTGWAAVDA